MIWRNIATSRPLVDALALANADRPRGLVVVTGGDDPLRIGDDRPVVQEHVDMVLGGEQRTDVAVEHEIRLDRALDGLLDGRVCRVHEVADPAADRLLPVGERVDVGVDPRILDVRHLGHLLTELSQ